MCLFQGRGVVRSVAGDRHDLAHLLKQGDEPDFVLGAGAGKNSKGWDNLSFEIFITLGGELGTGDCQRIALFFTDDSGLTGYLAGGEGVVPGHHNHPHPGVTGAGVNRLTHIVPDRIRYADNADEYDFGAFRRHIPERESQGSHSL